VHPASPQRKFPQVPCFAIGREFETIAAHQTEGLTRTFFEPDTRRHNAAIEKLHVDARAELARERSSPFQAAPGIVQIEGCERDDKNDEESGHVGMIRARSRPAHPSTGCDAGRIVFRTLQAGPLPMHPIDEPHAKLLQHLRAIAREELLPRFRGRLAVSEKADGSLVTSADHAVDARFRQLAEDLFPGMYVLSEEHPREEQETVLGSGEDFWLVDPLDGTTNFAGGLPFFAVSAARIRDGRVEFGATYDPVRDEMFSAHRAHGLLLNGERPPHRRFEPEHLARCTALVDFKRLPPVLAQALASQAPYRSQRNLGACALEWAWLAAGRADLYLHGGQALWDCAAGALMLAESGGHSTDLDGGPVFRRALTKPSAVAAGSRTLHERWLRWLDEKRRGCAPT
jgi:myo-inositol-1(or 4)-monophosphatase